MYGKRRIVFNKKNRVVLSGSNGQGGSHIPIGVYSKTEVGNGVTAKILIPKNMFESRLTNDNTIILAFKTLKELRMAVNVIYENELK